MVEEEEGEEEEEKTGLRSIVCVPVRFPWREWKGGGVVFPSDLCDLCDL